MKREEQKKLFQRWFKWAIISSTFLGLTYVTLHIIFPGTEVKTLSTEQVSTLNSLIVRYDTTKKTEVKNAFFVSIKNYLKTSLLTNFNEDDPTAINNINDLVNSHSTEYLFIVLPTYTFEVRSFFWLKGYKVYAELLFWVWFGVISSILYKVVNEYHKGCFAGKLIYDHIAKLVYAPLVAIVLYLCSDLLSSQKLIALDKISYGAIVFVFILGFFSGRAIELLNRVKDVIIPLNANSADGVENAQKFTVEGTVINATGIENLDMSECIITLKHKEQPSVNFNTKLGKDNVFSFEDVPEGFYQIEAELNVKDKNLIVSASKSLFIKKDATSTIVTVSLSLKQRF